jgi:hypothetical protein
MLVSYTEMILVRRLPIADEVIVIFCATLICGYLLGRRHSQRVYFSTGSIG